MKNYLLNVCAPRCTWLVAVLFSVVALSHGPALANEKLCISLFSGPKENLESSRLMSEIEKSFETGAAKYETPFERSLLWTVRKSIKKKIASDCHAKGCTEEDIARLVESSIVESFDKVATVKRRMVQVRGVAVLTGLSVGIAISSHFIKEAIPANDQWLTDFVSIATSMSLLKIGAPFWDGLSGIIYRGGFRINDGKSFLREEQEIRHYDEINLVLQEKMTPRQQQETARVVGLLNSLDSTMNSCLEGILSADRSKGGLNRASVRIANVAIKIRKFFPEMKPGPDDDDIVRTINSIFTRFLPDDGTRERLYGMIMTEIEKSDPAFKDPQCAATYRAAIASWVGVMRHDH